jgi:hypothetical protein
MSPETASLLSERIKESPYDKIVIYVSGGEPLLYPRLADFLNKITSEAGEKLKAIRLETSGLSSTEDKEAQMLGEILQSSAAKKMDVCASFHLFQKDFPQRLENILKMLLEKDYRLLGITIRLVLSCENFYDTFASLKKVFVKLSRAGFFITPWLLPIKKDSFNHRLIKACGNHISSRNTGKELYQAAMLCECAYLAQTYDLFKRRIMPIFLVANSFNPWRGRAKNLINHHPLFDITGCQALQKGYTDPSRDYVAVSTRGQYFPHECLPGNPPFSFGALEDISLEKAACLNKKITAEILKRIHASQEKFNKHRDLCEICVQHADNMGLRIN